MTSLTEHGVYDLVPITSVPTDQKIIRSKFVFKQKADSGFKARLVLQPTFKNPVSSTAKRLHQYAVPAASASFSL